MPEVTARMAHFNARLRHRREERLGGLAMNKTGISEQRVDERRGGARTQNDQHAEQDQNQNQRDQPVFFVLFQHRGKFAEQPDVLLFAGFLKFCALVVFHKMIRLKLPVIAFQINRLFRVAPVAFPRLVETLVDSLIPAQPQAKPERRENQVEKNREQNVADDDAHAAREKIPDLVKWFRNLRQQPQNNTGGQADNSKPEEKMIERVRFQKRNQRKYNGNHWKADDEADGEFFARPQIGIPVHFGKRIHHKCEKSSKLQHPSTREAPNLKFQNEPPI